MTRRLLSLAAMGVLLLAGACTTPPTDPEERAEAEAVNDPLEPTNRAIHDMNTYLDVHIMEPVADAYRDNTPDWLREGVHNVLTNLREPYIVGNELLQGDPKAAADALGRFMVNSTFGVLGAKDAVADSGGAKYRDSDLGMTMAVWGVGEGPYLVLPFLGPSNLRDGTGKVAEFWADPTGAVFTAEGVTALTYVRVGGDTLDTRTAYLDPVREIRRNSIDEYSAMRSLYRQHREATIAAARQSSEVGADAGTALPPAEATPNPAPSTPAPGGNYRLEFQDKPSGPGNGAAPH